VTKALPKAEYGPAMLALPTDKQRKFVEMLFICKSNAEAAREAGYGRKNRTHEAIAAHKLQRDPKIMAAIKEVGLSEAGIRRLPNALRARAEILSDIGHKDRARISEKIIERSIGAVESKHTMVVEHVDHTKDALDTLRYMKSIGATREMLENHFGFSGLGRYEQMLAIEDKSSNVIDGSFTEVKVPEPEEW
jgi:hypothetical protein